MCGIVAYLGHRQAHEVVIKGLKRLEYRGYDSAGIALLNQRLEVHKKQGKVKDLEEYLLEEVNPAQLNANLGMGHTRWATHGIPSDQNAHPHFSGSRRLSIIHNGIIENYDALKQELIKKGHQFESETDTEVLIHFIEDVKSHNGFTLEEAVRIALKRVVGAYAIVIMSADEPETLIAARKGSPLVLGLGKDEFFFASDATPIIEYANEVVYLNDNEVCVVQHGEFSIKDLNDVPTDPYIQKLDLELEAIEKGGFDHFMLKEIHEQPKSISDCMRGRINPETGTLMLGGIRDYIDEMVNANRIVIVACGTSWHAGLVAEYIFEDLCRIPVEVEYASEFRYRSPVINPGDIVIAISQSGETADTLAAVELAKSKGATVLGVCNVVGSSIARASHAGIYTHAGPEIGVASTKAFTAQLTVLTMFALLIGQRKKTLSEEDYKKLVRQMSRIPAQVEQALKLNDHIRYISDIYKDATNAIYLGRGYNFPVALEGALKLKEISYIHAEGYPAAEMKHGPIALIDEEMPVVFIATQDNSYEKIVSNIQEVKARKGQVIAIVTEGDRQIADMADHVLEVPESSQLLMPLISVIPLQLLSYHIALLRGCNVDQPRNLAKSVTVE
jgi:glucosamine--fructose-6-phosphate aminotransferase (isomerizing)